MPDQDLKELKVEDTDVGQRLDHFLVAKVPAMTRSQLRRLIDEGRVTINNNRIKSGLKLELGTVIKVLMPEEQPYHLIPEPMNLDILYEDEDIVVVNKPIGLVMHPGAGHAGPTLVHGLLAHCGKNLSYLGDHPRPGIVHRLDRDTSGVVVCAKNNHAHIHLAAQFEKKTNFRQYVALLDGALKPNAKSLVNWLARDPNHRTKFRSWANENEAPDNAKRAVSHFQKVTTYQERLTQVSVQLETGRTHQIRVHAVDLGMPVVGDQTYHRPVQLPETFPYVIRDMIAKVPRQLLHARYLGIEHPRTGAKLAFEAPLPPDFAKVLSDLEEFRDP